MVEGRFEGNYYHTLDAKHRLFIPAQFRKILGEEDTKFVVMKAPKPEKCLYLYPMDTWKVLEEELDSMPSGAESRKKNRLVYSRIDIVSFDKQGRIVLKEDYCEYAGFIKEVFVLGAGKKIELWGVEEWQSMSDSVEEEDFDWNEIPW